MADQQLRVRSRLPALIQAAQDHWGPLPTRRVLTALQVQKGIGAHQTTIKDYLDDTGRKFWFDTLARICWFFGCSVDSVLAVEREPGVLPPVVIGRTTIPAQLPPAGTGAIRVLNFIPGQVELHYSRVRAQTTWYREAVLQLMEGGRASVERQTLETLLAVLDLDRVSQLVEVQCDLQAADPQATKLAEAIRIREPRPVWLERWEETVQHWRSLVEQIPAPGTVTATDIAVLRFLQQRFATTLTRDSLAVGLGIRRSLLHAIADRTIHPEIGPDDVPASLRHYLDEIAPADWLTHAAITVEQAYQHQQGTSI
ncbi:MAG TPA: helix-turn-helix transcriptional regulator [Herpetosiphonaceae bacterium]